MLAAIDHSRLLATAVTLLLAAALVLAARPLLERFGRRHRLKHRRVLYMQKTVKYLALGLTLAVVCIIWGVNLAGIWVVASSLFGILGIAFFAQWSLLSNVTGSFVLFFSSPFKIDDHITLQDGDNSVTGEVEDMTLFYVRLRTDAGQLVSVPNNLMLQKAVVRHGSAGD